MQVEPFKDKTQSPTRHFATYNFELDFPPLRIYSISLYFRIHHKDIAILIAENISWN